MPPPSPSWTPWPNSPSAPMGSFWIRNGHAGKVFDKMWMREATLIPTVAIHALSCPGSLLRLSWSYATIIVAGVSSAAASSRVLQSHDRRTEDRAVGRTSHHAPIDASFAAKTSLAGSSVALATWPQKRQPKVKRRIHSNPD